MFEASAATAVYVVSERAKFRFELTAAAAPVVFGKMFLARTIAVEFTELIKYASPVEGIAVILADCVIYIPASSSVVVPVRILLPCVLFAVVSKFKLAGVEPVVLAARETYKRLPYAKKLAAVKNVSGLWLVGLPNL